MKFSVIINKLKVHSECGERRKCFGEGYCFSLQEARWAENIT